MYKDQPSPQCCKEEKNQQMGMGMRALIYSGPHPHPMSSEGDIAL